MDDLNNSEVVKSIADTIVKLLYTKDKSDKTFTAKISASINEGKYKILYNGNTYTATSSIFCQAEDIVKVCAPQNNWQKLYIVENNTSGRSLRDMYKDIEELKKLTFDVIYPVGSIYMSTVSTNPSAFFGGTWVAWGSGRVPVGVNTSDGNFNTVEKTGGANTHTHTNPNTGAATGNTGSTTLNANQIPVHSHVTRIYNKNNTNYTSALTATGYFKSGVVQWSDTAITTAGGDRGDPIGVTGDAGGNGGHTHTLNSHTHTVGATGTSSSLQPYITCYMWKRTK